MILDILKPEIFPNDKIISGVTKINNKVFPAKGFSLAKAEVYSEEEVEQHRIVLAEYLNTELKNLKFQKQTHSNIIRVIGKDSDIAESDTMITAKKGIFLNVLLADCLGILLFDTENEIIAAVHSGWRGTKQKIIYKTIDKMIETYATKPDNLIAYLSPCASGKKYQIGGEVAKYFPNHITQISKTHFLFDNQKKIFDDLISIGVKSNNIEKSDICTISDTDYHSFRRDNNNSGRMSAFISLI